MEILGHSMCAVALGVLLSLGIIVLNTENPAKIPLHKVFVRALFGLAFFFIFFFVISFPIYSLIISKVPLVSSLEGIGRWFFACAVGLGVPILVRAAKNNLIGKRSATIFRVLTMILQYLDEITALYLGRIIDREERKASYDVMAGNANQATCAIYRLFEYHLEGIAHDVAKHSKYADKEKVKGLVKTRNTAIKFKFLLRYLGYKDCFAAINTVKGKPESILPTWPYVEAEPDRRKSYDRRINSGEYHTDRRKLPHGQRKLDLPEALNIILSPIAERERLAVSNDSDKLPAVFDK
ncbi:MAG: hypothetical protein ABR577_15975 [Pyrinomonadaceae bacterium]